MDGAANSTSDPGKSVNTSKPTLSVSKGCYPLLTVDNRQAWYVGEYWHFSSESGDQRILKNTWKGKCQNYTILYLYICFSSNKNMLKLFKQEKEVTDVENKDKLK